MSALSHFDRVVLMADGCVVDTGSVRELLQRQALFRAMYHGAGTPTNAGRRSGTGRTRSGRQKVTAATTPA